jgi:SAM-dependent methyltransferase
MLAIDLGCGNRKADGAYGADLVALPPVDVAINLKKYPLPFAADSFDRIVLNDVIEHVPETLEFMEELHRVARPGASIEISVINWNTIFTAMDPTHVRNFTANTFDFFGGREGRNYYTHARFEVASVVKGYDARWRHWVRSERLLEWFGLHLCNVLKSLDFKLVAVKPPAAGPAPATLAEAFRCPHCVAAGGDRGRLRRAGEHWLVCEEPGCGRKYPVHAGLPILLHAEGARWISTPVAELPAPPPGRVRRAGPEDFPTVFRHDVVPAS